MSHFEGTVYHGGEGTVGGEQLQLGLWEHNTRFSSHLCGLGGREREREGRATSWKPSIQTCEHHVREQVGMGA